ncbi:MAG: sulfite exporter TauE/SafE family protein, partial [Anaerolineae bacterium]|nr:sulfite exporter TauE/SafE family protein [Anaerolineae bacterium]
LTYTPRNWHGWFAGWASGFASTLANTGGPPFTIYLLLQSLQPVAFIGTVTLFFAVVNFLKIPLFLQQGLLDIETVLQLAWALPLLPLGVWLGRRSVDLFDQKLFERVLLVLLVGSVLLLIGTL